MSSGKINDLANVADWAAYNGFDLIYAETINLLQRICPYYTPSEQFEWRGMFFKVNILLQRVTNTREDNFHELLASVSAVESLFKDSMTKHIPQYKWITVRRQIITQISICILLRHMSITEDLEVQLDPNTLVIPPNFNYAAYKKDILHLYEVMRPQYPTDALTGQTTEEFAVDSIAMTKDMLTVRADGKKVFSKVRVISFFDAHPLRKFKETLMDFFRNVESIMLPTPRMSVQYLNPVSEDSEVRELMRSATKPVWSQDQRDTFGPYSAVKKTDKGVSSSAAKGSDPKEVSRRLSDNFQQLASASKLPSSPSALVSNVIQHAENRSPSTARPTSASSATTATSSSSYVAAATHLMEKYSALDPLRDILDLDLVDANTTDAYHVRTSHEHTSLPANKGVVRKDEASSDDDEEGIGKRKLPAEKKTAEPRKKAAVSGRRSAGSVAAKTDKVLFSDEEVEDEIEDVQDDDDEEDDEGGESDGSDYLAAHTSSSAGKKGGKKTKGPGKAENKRAARALMSLGSERKRKSSSGSLRIKWSFDEEETLINGVKIHGCGNWALILKDPRYKGMFHECRTNVHLKDKYRNLEKVGRV